MKHVHAFRRWLAPISAATFERLLALKEQYDPNDMFRANHPVRREADALT